MPYLSWISVQPPLVMSPAFNPLVTEYRANVTYDQLMVRLAAQAQNCQTEVRIDDKYGPTRFVPILISFLDRNEYSKSLFNNNTGFVQSSCP